MPVRRKILVVDHNPRFTNDTKEILEERGYEVSVVSDPKSYYGIINNIAKRKKKFDVVIMDMYFPDAMVKGLDLIQYARKSGLDSLPFIVVSGSDVFNHRNNFSELGVNHFFSKPLNYKTLEAYLHDTIFGSDLNGRSTSSKKSDFLANIDNLDMYTIFFNYFDPLGLIGRLSDDEIVFVNQTVNERIIKGNVLMQKTIEDVISSINAGSGKGPVINEHICNDKQYLDFILRYLNKGLIKKQQTLDLAEESTTTVSGFISDIKKYRALPPNTKKEYDKLITALEANVRPREAYYLEKNLSLLYAFSRVKRLDRAMKKILKRTADTMTDLKLYAHDLGAKDIGIITEKAHSDDFFGIKFIASNSQSVPELFHKCYNLFAASRNYRIEVCEYQHINYRGDSSIPRLFVRRGDDISILDPDNNPDMIEVLVCCPSMLIKDEYIGKNAHALHEIQREKEYKDGWTRKQKKYRDELYNDLLKRSAPGLLLLQST